MELKFNSVEEVLQFVAQLRPQPTPVARPAVMEPQDAYATLQRILDDPRKGKIQAIKVYRALTGLGLKESKDAVDKMWPFSGRF